jgi:hypothetical protein
VVAGFDFDFVSVTLVKGYMTTLLILLCFALTLDHTVLLWSFTCSLIDYLEFSFLGYFV